MASTSDLSLELFDRSIDLDQDDSNSTARLPSMELTPITTKRQIMVLASSFMAVFLTIGVNQAYGVLQSHYTNISSPGDVLTPQQAQNPALVALVGTVAAGLTWGGSIVVNPLMARTSDLRRLTALGTLLMAAGYALASLSRSLWQLFLTQALLSGTGSALLYFPLLSVAPEYFGRRRGAAMGLILSGAGVGGLCLSLVTQTVLLRFGARWTLRIMALIMLAVGLPVAACTSPSRSVARRPTLVNMRIARKPAFVLQAVAALLQAGGNFVPITFMPDFAVAMGYSAAAGALFLAVNNGINSASRIGMGVIADAVGRQNTLVVSAVGSTISVMALWSVAAVGGGAADGRVAWIGFVTLYGILAGGYNALFPTTLTDLFGIQAYASVNGFLYFVRGLGALLGSPVGGVILSANKGAGKGGTTDFQNVIWYDGALLLGSTLCVVGVRVFDSLDKGSWRWKA